MTSADVSTTHYNLSKSVCKCLHTFLSESFLYFICILVQDLESLSPNCVSDLQDFEAKNDTHCTISNPCCRISSFGSITSGRSSPNFMLTASFLWQPTHPKNPPFFHRKPLLFQVTSYDSERSWVNRTRSSRRSPHPQVPEGTHDMTWANSAAHQRSLGCSTTPPVCTWIVCAKHWRKT